MSALPRDLVAIAEQQLGETPEIRAATLQQLRSRIDAMPDDASKPVQTDDEYLVLFLRHAKFQVERAHERMCAMSAFLHEHREKLADLRADEFRKYSACGLSVLRGKARCGARMIALCPAELLLRYGSADEMFATSLRFYVWAFQQLARDPYIQVHGLIVLQDLAGFTFTSALRLAGNSAVRHRQRMFRFLQSCNPFRIRAVHAANDPVYVDFLFALVRPFMHSKVQARVHFHGRRLDALLEVVSSEELPALLGGTLEQHHGEAAVGSNGGGDSWLEEMIAAEAEGRQGATGLRT